MADELRRDIDDFYSYLANEKRASPFTLKSYHQVLEKVYEVLTKNFPELTSFTQLEKQHMRLLSREFNFSEDMEELKSSTIAHSVYALSSFFKFMILRGRIDKNPVDLIKAPRVKKSLPQVLTLNEVLSILDMIHPQNNYQVRDLCMVELMFSSGLRVGELVSLNIGSIDFGQRELRVMGKGSKERVVPIGSQALYSLHNYLHLRGEFKPVDDALFVNKYGKRITTRAVEQNLNKLAQLADLGGKVTPHKFRHAFATELLAHGADLRTVQELLGHASLAATQIYTHVNLEQMRRTYNKAHPRAIRREA